MSAFAAIVLLFISVHFWFNVLTSSKEGEINVTYSILLSSIKYVSY